MVIDNCGCRDKPKLAKYIAKKAKDERTGGKTLSYLFHKIVDSMTLVLLSTNLIIFVGLESYLRSLSHLEKATRLSHPESGMIDGVIALISVINSQCKSFVFVQQSAYKMEYLSNYLRYKERKDWVVCKVPRFLTLQLNLRGRTYIGEANFVPHSAKKKQEKSHTLYLFNDIIIATL